MSALMKEKTMKKILRLLVLLILILVVVAVVVLYKLDVFVKTGIEKGGTYALGVDTTVEDVDLSLIGGRLNLDNLKIANVEGYETPHLMKTGRFELGVNTGTLMDETVVVNKFELDGLDVNIEQKSLTENNISAIMNNIKRFESKEAKPAEEAPEAEKAGKKVRVDRILIKNVSAHVKLPSAMGSAGELSINVPEIELTGVSSDPNGVPVHELIRQILPAILMAVVEKGEGKLPDNLANVLTQDIQSATAALGENAEKLMQQAKDEVGKKISEVTEQAGKSVEDAKKQLDEGMKSKQEELQKSVGEGLGGLLGGKKEEEKE
jgi:hypothetical protein